MAKEMQEGKLNPNEGKLKALQAAMAKTEKSSSGFTEEKGRVHHTVRTTCKRISEITDQS